MDMSRPRPRGRGDKGGVPQETRRPSAKIRVSRPVYDGIEAVRISGLTTMLSRSVVIDLARLFGYEETAAWVRSHWREYARGLCRGFDPNG